jgi:hypothetical protein
MASEPRPGVADARHLAREWSPRAVETLYDVMTNRSASIANQLAAAQGILDVAQLMESEAATEMPT